MKINNFQQRKNEILSKKDKSSKGNWDNKIMELCKKINSSENFYTTSSCSGRIAIMINSNKKKSGLFQFISHDLISFENLKNDLLKTKTNQLIKFKQEPCILHIACKNLETANDLYQKAKLVGWKRSGIISWRKNFILELNSTEKLELPIIENKKILVDDDFLKLIVKIANKNLKKCWEKIGKFEELIN